MVAKNTVTGCNLGIDVLAGNNGTGGAQVRRNVASGNTSIGINVNDAAPYVWCNTANDNRSVDGFFGSGIRIGAVGTTTGQTSGTVTGNTANNNVQVGIEATTDTTDGGGNTATGNGIRLHQRDVRAATRSTVPGCRRLRGRVARGSTSHLT